MIQDELTVSQKETLRGLPERFPPERIDCLWLFSPHVVKARESGFIVITLFSETEPGRHRTLLTVRYESEPIKGRMRREERVTEEGSAPPDRIERVIAGVMARTGADAADPILEEIRGDPARWDDLLGRAGLGPPPVLDLSSQ